MKNYEVVLSTGTWYILAPNSEAAAWAALELSKDKNANLIDVRLEDEW